MKQLFISVLLILPILISVAQPKCKIKKAYAFYTVSVPGMQMVDENGNPIPPQIDITRFIYLEWSGLKRPEIETVLYNKKPLLATVTAVPGSTVNPESEFVNTNGFKITASKNNSLWKIDLQTVSGSPMPDQNCKNIIIKIKGTGKTCAFKLVNERQIMTLPRY